jgi:hypothetical protein
MSVSKNISRPLQELKQLATDLTSSTPSSLTVPRRVCFITVNSYTNPSVTLGTGPISDACTVASAAKYAGIDCYFIHNATRSDFLRWFDKFLSEASSCLFFYYVGHGTQVPSSNGDEADQMDEAYYFEDGVVIDDVLLDHLIKNKNKQSTVILISDCCHSGSIWDLTDYAKDPPPRVISIAAAQDSQTSKQIVVDKEVLNVVSRVEAGVFTSGMFGALKANIRLTPLELKAKLDSQLKKYQQNVTVETTSPEMLEESLFQPVKAAPLKPATTLAQAGATIVQKLKAPLTEPQPVDEQPVVTEGKGGKKTELHRRFTKIRPDGVYNFHITATTFEIPGKAPRVETIVEITKKDNKGRVTTEVRKHGKELSWHAGKSKWSHAPLTKTVDVSRLPTWQDLPDFHPKGDPLRRFMQPTVGPWKTTRQFQARPSLVGPRFETTSMTYGGWNLE